MNLLFLGAGKRLSLLEAFQASAHKNNIELDIFSMESNVYVPIAKLANVFHGPKFHESAFSSALREAVIEYDIDIVIPNMDSATVALSCSPPTGAWHLVSNSDLCKAMEDKYEAKKWFQYHSLPVPVGQNWPRIVKSRLGYGARDQFVVSAEMELQALGKRINLDDYIVEPFINGPEYSVDAYVASDGRLLGAYTRQRLAVVNGEVDVSLSKSHPTIDMLSRRILSLPGWLGPVTLQFIDGPMGPLLIEINPRFGGGATHAIHGGLDMPTWIFREMMGLPVDPCLKWEDGSLMTRCMRDVFHDSYH
jgi:carbamoyl-phosphate synthase large subunit